ncbi:hypothetical protein HDV05_006290, partial [Chytridiales sp. JEL 0842]
MQILNPDSYLSEAELRREMERVGGREYVDFLLKLDGGMTDEEKEQGVEEWGLQDDCPIFQGLSAYIKSLTSGTLLSTHSLLRRTSSKLQTKHYSNITFHLPGGRHHAHPSQPSGFCYINDCTLALLTLSDHYNRVLYIDLDVHHADGVQHVFEFSDRVLTLDFHVWAPGFFPGTGGVEERGKGKRGKGYTVNVALEPGLRALTLVRTFEKILGEVWGRFRPEAVVVQCGADGCGGDPVAGSLGWNLDVRAVGECVRIVMNFCRRGNAKTAQSKREDDGDEEPEPKKVKLDDDECEHTSDQENTFTPLLLLGGGGYNTPTTSRCWTYLTFLVLRESNLLPPFHPYNSLPPLFSKTDERWNMDLPDTDPYFELYSSTAFQLLDTSNCVGGIINGKDENCENGECLNESFIYGEETGERWWEGVGYSENNKVMPSQPPIRIALSLNSNQTIKSVVVIPTSCTDIPNFLLQAAKKKLRIQRPTRLFLEGGEEVDFGFTEEAKVNAGRVWKNGEVVLVSAGEAYIGALSGSPTRSELVAVTMLANKAYVDPEAIEQLHQTAALPGMKHVVGMPDLCPGNKFPVGAVFVTKGVVYPELIGGDIGCGMSLYHLPTLHSDTLPHPTKIASKLQTLDLPCHQASTFLSTRNYLNLESKYADHNPQLGTIGGGNHFAELQIIENIMDESTFHSLNLQKDSVVLLVHSGSRGLGKRIHDAHVKEFGHGKGLSVYSSEGREYLKLHEEACVWAGVNRDLIAERVVGMLLADGVVPVNETLLRKVLDISHNSIETLASTSECSETSYLHRKGAAPSIEGHTVPIPGSRGSFTYLVQPRGPQISNAFSLPHGAGRKWTRAKAVSMMKSKLDRGVGQLGAGGLDALKVTSLGGVVVCEDKTTLMEEVPEAYKEIEEVVADVEGCAKAVAILRPVVTYKVR